MAGSSFSVDTREFSRALAAYKRVSKSTLAQIINRKVAFIIRKAMALTPLASRNAIANVFNVIGSRLSRSKKTGALKKAGNLYGKSRLAVDIVQAKRYYNGDNPLTQAEARAQGQKLVANRLRAVGSLRAGWAGVLRKFIGAAKGAVDNSEMLPKVKRPGTGTTAKAGPDPEATFIYDLVTARGGKSKQIKDIDPRVVTALQEAINMETASMEEETARRMQQDANRFNAR